MLGEEKEEKKRKKREKKATPRALRSRAKKSNCAYVDNRSRF